MIKLTDREVTSVSGAYQSIQSTAIRVSLIIHLDRSRGLLRGRPVFFPWTSRPHEKTRKKVKAMIAAAF